MEAGRTPDDPGGRRADHHRQLDAAQLHRPVPGPDHPGDRRWRSRSTPWPRGWPTRSAPPTWPPPPTGWASPRRSRLDPSMALGAVEVSPLEMAQAYDAVLQRRLSAPRATASSASAPPAARCSTTTASAGAQRRAVIGQPALAVHDPDDAPGDRLRHRHAGRGPGLRPGRQDRHHQRLPDAWFVGYTGGFVTAVWVGKDDNTPMQQGHRRRRAGRHLARLHDRRPAAPEGRSRSPAATRRRRRQPDRRHRRRSSTASQPTCCTATTRPTPPPQPAARRRDERAALGARRAA